MQILIVEDNQELGQTLENGIREHGWDVKHVESLHAASGELAKQNFDAVVLDRMLPDGDGLELVRQLRQQKQTTPVLVLTAKTAVEDRITGLDSGADDYLTKPFSFPELLARVRAMKRRDNYPNKIVMEVADLRLDPRERTVVRGGREIELSEMQFQLLYFLMQHVGEVVSRKMILESVWDPTSENLSNVVDVYINRLRKKIDHDFEKPLIHTLRGVGYVLKSD